MGLPQGMSGRWVLEQVWAPGRPANALQTRVVNEHPLGPSTGAAQVNCSFANEAPLALPLGELARPKVVTERAMKRPVTLSVSLTAATSPRGRGKGCGFYSQYSPFASQRVSGR